MVLNFKTMLMAVLCALCFTAVHADSPKRIDVPAGDLVAALESLSKQAEVNLVYQAVEMQGIKTQGVRGTLTPREAVMRLLQGTDLRLSTDETTGAMLISGPGSASKISSTDNATLDQQVRLATADERAAGQSTQSADDQNRGAGNGASRSDAASDSGESAKLDEVVVTARKRTESLQDVPMSVSALGGAELSKVGIENVDNLYGRVPNLFSVTSGLSTASDSTYLVIRGIGFNGGQEPATGVFVDGVFQPAIGFDMGFLDLERIEVLRGPQGTLYGRNTQAGALNIVTRKPSETFRSRFEVEAAEFDTKRALASVSGPIAGNFFGGLAAEYGASDGYVENTNPGGRGKYYDRRTVRGGLRWLPTQGLEINLQGDVSQKAYNDMSFGVPKACKCFRVNEDTTEDTKDIYGAALTIDWAASSRFSVTSITGMRKVRSDITNDMDLINHPGAAVLVPGIPETKIVPNPILVYGNDYNTRFRQGVFSQELRVSGTGGSNLDWQLGAYYFRQTENYQRRWFIGPDVAIDPALSFFVPLHSLQNIDQDRDGGALFGQTSWRPTEKLELTLGGRYAQETPEQSGESTAVLPTVNVFINTDIGQKSHTFSSVTGMGSISYKINEQAKAYFTVSQGWKAGGFNKQPEDFSPSYDDEKSINYEVGLKSQLLDRRLQSNLSVFYVDITDQQLTGIIYIDGLPRSIITNAGKSASKGVELELTARPTDRITFTGALGYADARFKDFLDGTGGPPGVQRSGERFPLVPDLSASVTASYVHPLSNGMDLEFFADFTHIGSYTDESGSFGGLGKFAVPNQDRVNVQVSVLASGWTITGYVRNLFDSYDITNASAAQNFFPTPDNLYVAPLPPRHVGFKVSKEF